MAAIFVALANKKQKELIIPVSTLWFFHDLGCNYVNKSLILAN